MSIGADVEKSVDRELLLRIYATVARVRAFDDKAKALITNAQAFFVHYPVRGHEIIAAAVAAAIEPDDYMTVTYRGVADEVAKGVSGCGRCGRRCSASRPGRRRVAVGRCTSPIRLMG